MDKSKKQKDENDNITYWKIWNCRPLYQIPTTPFTLKGYSIAALRTNFYI